MTVDRPDTTSVCRSWRIAALDTLRGLTLVSMIAYHTCWDLVYLFGMDWELVPGHRRVHLAAEHLLDVHPAVRVLLAHGAASPPPGADGVCLRLRS